MRRPLEGVKVLELATFIAGPCCARYLADLGAEVIKVESLSGDPLRFTAVNEGRPYGDQEDTSFTLENAGKKCIALNLKSENGKEAFEKLLAQSDIFITNWRQPALKRSNLDYESLKEKYPKLVYGYVSGYGETGPDKDLPGFDFTSYFARGGIMGTMYDKEAKPLTPIAGFGDHQVGMYLTSGIIAALYRAKQTGEGDQVTVSLFHTAIWDIALYLQCNQYGHKSTQYPISQKEIANQLQVAHKTKDDRWVQFAMPRYDYYYPIFMKAIGREDLIDDARYFPQTALQENLAEFYEIIKEQVATYTLEEVEQIMKTADLPYAVCQTWEQLLKDEQAWQSHALTNVTFPNGAQRAMVRTPVLFASTDLPPYERGAFLGEHTQEILEDLGYSKENIEKMISSGEANGCTRIG